jgi:hypothetical protein
MARLIQSLKFASIRLIDPPGELCAALHTEWRLNRLVLQFRCCLPAAEIISP